MNTLEVLYAAKARLEGGEYWDYGSWTSCTCGHIYAAAVGRKGRVGDVHAARGEYRHHIEAVARALGWTELDGGATGFVSEFTWRVTNPTDRTDRDVPLEDALVVIDKAIAAIEAEQEHDRLAVLEQARKVVDAVPVEVPA